MSKQCAAQCFLEEFCSESFLLLLCSSKSRQDPRSRLIGTLCSLQQFNVSAIVKYTIVINFNVIYAVSKHSQSLHISSNWQLTLLTCFKVSTCIDSSHKTHTFQCGLLMRPQSTSKNDRNSRWILKWQKFCGKANANSEYFCVHVSKFHSSLLVFPIHSTWCHVEPVKLRDFFFHLIIIKTPICDCRWRRRFQIHLVTVGFYPCYKYFSVDRLQPLSSKKKKK